MCLETEEISLGPKQRKEASITFRSVLFAQDLIAARISGVNPVWRGARNDLTSRMCTFMAKYSSFAMIETRRNWAELTFAKTSGTVSFMLIPSHDPINNCGTHFGSSSLLASRLVSAKLGCNESCLLATTWP